MEKTVKFDTNNGLDLNVQKYKELPLWPVALDLKKSHTTLDNLSELEKKINDINIQGLKHVRTVSTMKIMFQNHGQKMNCST